MLKCYNDCKEKIQSFEVWCDDETMSLIDKGYGEDFDSAKTAFLFNVDSHIKKLLRCRKELDDSKVVMVSSTGTPIK